MPIIHTTIIAECPSVVMVNSKFTVSNIRYSYVDPNNVQQTYIGPVQVQFNNKILNTSTGSIVLTQPSTQGKYTIKIANNIQYPFYPVTTLNVQVIDIKKQRIASLYTSSNTKSIIKILNNVQIQQTTLSRQSYTENNQYSNIYNKIILDNNSLELTKPLQYNESFYQKYKKVQLPLQSSVANTNTGEMFYNMYPYSGLLNNKYSSVPLNFTDRNSYTIIKDIYVNEQINNQYLYIPPINTTGVKGYSIFINGHFLYNSNTIIKSMNNNIPLVDYTFDNPINIHNMFSPGRNRIVVILNYDSNQPYIYSDYNMNFQIDLLINNKPYIWSGLYNQNFNFIKQQNMNQNNLMIGHRYDNIVFITR